MLSRVFLLPAFGCLLTLTFFLNTQGIALASKTCVSQKQRALQDQQKQAARCFRSPLELRRVVPVKDAPKALHPAITLDNTFRQTYHASNLPSGQYKRLFKIAQKAYKKQFKHTDPKVGLLARRHAADMYLFWNEALCNYEKKARTMITKTTREKFRKQVLKALEKRKIPARLRARIAEKFLASPKGQELMRCIREKANHQVTIQIYKMVIDLRPQIMSLYEDVRKHAEKYADIPTQKHAQRRIRTLTTP